MNEIREQALQELPSKIVDLQVYLNNKSFGEDWIATEECHAPFLPHTLNTERTVDRFMSLVSYGAREFSIERMKELLREESDGALAELHHEVDDVLRDYYSGTTGVTASILYHITGLMHAHAQTEDVDRSTLDEEFSRCLNVFFDGMLRIDNEGNLIDYPSDPLDKSGAFEQARQLLLDFFHMIFAYQTLAKFRIANGILQDVWPITDAGIDRKCDETRVYASNWYPDEDRSDADFMLDYVKTTLQFADTLDEHVLYDALTEEYRRVRNYYDPLKDKVSED